MERNWEEFCDEVEQFTYSEFEDESEAFKNMIRIFEEMRREIKSYEVLDK